jgi:hypothetical protein
VKIAHHYRDAEEFGALLRRKSDRQQRGEASDGIEREWTRWNFACPAIKARFTALKWREAPAPTYRLLLEDRVQPVSVRQSPSQPPEPQGDQRARLLW